MTIFDIGDEIWITQKGEKIRYRDLTESHIKNIAKKTFRIVCQYTSMIDNMDNDIEIKEVSYAKEMELELLRRTVCKTLNIEL